MDAIIAKILEIDHNARDIIRDAETKQSDSDDIIASEKDRLKKQIVEESAHRTDSVRQNLISKAQQEARLHEEHSAEKIAQMETRAEEYTDQWVDTLYKRITEGY